MNPSSLPSQVASPVITPTPHITMNPKIKKDEIHSALVSQNNSILDNATETRNLNMIKYEKGSFANKSHTENS